MKYINMCLVAVAFSAIILISCEDGNDTIGLELSSSIPSDASAKQSPEISFNNITIPNMHYLDEDYEGESVVRLDMTGLWDSSNQEWMYLYGTGSSKQNVWLELDDTPKGFLIHNTIDDKDIEHVAQADLVFVIDNSGTMEEESDAVARDVIDWARELDASGTDVRFSCVGYRYGNVNGAIDFTDASELSSFLNYSSGTNRTAHFGGYNSSSLKSWANYFYNVENECGAMGIRYADTYFSFRSGANRIYINITDEPNQPDYHTYYSTESFKNNWSAQQGTIHTVYSNTDTLRYNEKLNINEKPWRLSWYTGGSILFTDSSFSNVNLSLFPVSGAIQNSYIIRFVISNSLRDGKYHNLTVTVKSKDGQIQAKKNFSINFNTY